MSDKQSYTVEMKKAFQVLNEEADSMETCYEQIRKVLLIAADILQLGSVECSLEAPVTKLRPHGEHIHTQLYENGECAGEPEVYENRTPDGGIITIRGFAKKGQTFSEEDKAELQCLFREIFDKLSARIMRQLLETVMQTDMATGVYNQEALMRYVARLMQMGCIGEYVGLFFNVHNFKYVNKVFPYHEGDAVLRKYALAVRMLLQEGEKVARLGGDNFVAIVHRSRWEEVVGKIQDIRIVHQAAGKRKEFRLGATIGASGLDGLREPGDVMSHVSIAYQMARRKGAGSVVLYSEEIKERLLEDQGVIANFAPALERGEFVVYYQPKIHIQNRTLYGAEALVRWKRRGKLVPPVQFVPQLEREGSICRLDYYVLEQVCRFLRSRMDKGEPLTTISVNFSRKHLDEEDLVEHIVAVIDRYEIEHQWIEIELTESEDFQNYELMSGVVDGLQKRGVGTAIDDFGTGFSSLNMIKQVNLDIIKIDKSFIPYEKEYPGKEKDKIMFSNIVQLVKELGKKTVAEGVETEEQLNYIQKVGCDIVQGYVYDKPLEQDEFETRMNRDYAWKCNA